MESDSEIIRKIHRNIDFLQNKFSFVIVIDDDDFYEKRTINYRIFSFSKKTEDAFFTDLSFESILYKQIYPDVRSLLKLYTLNEKRNSLQLISSLIEDTQSLINKYIPYQSEFILRPEYDYSVLILTNPEYEYCDEEPIYEEIQFNELKNSQYKSALNSIKKISQIEYNFVKKLNYGLSNYYWKLKIKPSIITFKNEGNTLKAIAEELHKKGFINHTSIKPFIDFFSGYPPSDPIVWMKESSSFANFIHSFLSFCELPKGNKTWGYFERNPVFLNSKQKEFTNLRSPYDQSKYANYKGEKELKEIFSKYLQH
ncbi:MAG TPA: hypothetical protein PLH91_00720 [Tenuifilaceae bacterium]|nr:hypothetical protein [Tenuifilaceae bacterium]HPI43727.1 hypothetical protein [Tenuifilaceae bacterium]HPN21025.1 hypothetical protein [Tenuifilaceae bacterium]